MPVNWFDVQKSISPIKSYEVLCQRWQESLSYSFVRRVFNKTMPGLADYTRLSVGGDPQHRYDEYAAHLVYTFAALQQAGVRDLLDLFSRVRDRSSLESFHSETTLPAPEIARVLKYLNYWFLPMPKYLGSLVRLDPEVSAAVKVLQRHAIRTNLDILEAGDTLSKRTSLAERSALPPSIIERLVNRADFSRMPWTSKATISNIIGAGYGSLHALAHANPEKLYADYFQYGKNIGKNLKLGNEIENSHRIAKIVPTILLDESLLL
jgi:hypothetical protein